jgi:hypothetical protein
MSFSIYEVQECELCGWKGRYIMICEKCGFYTHHHYKTDSKTFGKYNITSYPSLKKLYKSEIKKGIFIHIKGVNHE